ncbi:ParB/RepB/Spo0J family partition protein [Cohaesibacter haloalkalitolerans]|uniref:ParB/RepB/Spo0J family partition protein n=1 Tax=Cohaesibacter haloalkalitolerans TaxID=1162980 RepID=UPI000E65C82F|nr:ParB/RepB/Spo0J family partition protein [Cohaesibacter haloalkalitolerans]
MTKKSASKTIANFPLSKLVLSPINPRQDVDAADIEALAQSIKACGLLQNLIGIKEGDTIGIVAGGRRFRALTHLLETNDILASFPVPVRIADDEEQALEWANTENNARKDLNPVEEIKAYGTMAQKGFTSEKIAIAFAQTVRHVKGRLKLANLAPCILEALTKGEITLDTAAAYTVCDDQERQADIFESLSHSWGGDNARTIKRLLMEEANTATDRRARLVGREAYEAAGGKVREDLFGEEVYFLDSDILERLTREALEAERQTLLAEGWKWVEVGEDMMSYDERAKFDRLYPTPFSLSEETQRRFDALMVLYNEGKATELEVEELTGLEEVQKPQFLPVDMDFSGVYLWLDGQGTIRADEGYVRPEDREGAVKAGLLAESEAVAEPAVIKEEKPDHSQALLADMAVIRTGALQAAILEDDDLAKDIAIFAMVTKAWESALPCDIASGLAQNEVEEHGQTLPEALTLGLDWNRPSANVVAERFAAFRKKTDQEKTDILTAAVARSLTANIHVGNPVPFVDLLADTVKLDVRNTWTPNSTFLKRLKSPQLDEIMSFIDSKPVSANFANMKKSDKVARLHGLFNNEEDRNGLSPEAKDRIASWVPDCMINQPLTLEQTSCQEEDEQDLAA